MKVVHFNCKKYHFMPLSGPHTETMCGKWFQLKNCKDWGRYESDFKKVTCKRCIKIFNKKMSL